MSDYTIDRGAGVRERMDLLAAAHAPGTLGLLDLLGVPEPGARCADLGCGGGHVTRELARRAGSTGEVVGIDLDEELLQLAAEQAAAEGLGQVTFHAGSVETYVGADLDVVYARMLLSHLRDPAEMIRRMAAAARPGGIVIVEDVQFAGCFAEPACSAYDRWIGWFREAVRRTAGDLEIGPRLPGLLRAARLTGIGVRVAQAVNLDGSVKQLQQQSMAKVRAAVIAAGLTTPEEFDAAHAELRAFTDDPTTILASPRMVQSWGRRA
jgi:SAM-dependent methyltransferase